MTEAEEKRLLRYLERIALALEAISRSVGK